MFVEIDGVRLAYDDRGDGEPLVCLHAIGHDRSDYRNLEAGRVIALDWPGQGESGPDHQPPTSRRYAELLAGFLDALRLDRVVLLGNSIGGGAAIAYAARHPERVRGLVLANPSGLDAGGRLVRWATRFMARFFAAGARRARWFGRAYALYYRLVLQRARASADRARIIAAGYRYAPILRDAWIGFGQADNDLRPLAPAIRCPTLFAWARRDQIIQLRRCKAAIATFPDARVELFDAGHAPQLETPDELNASLAGFLEALRPEPALAANHG